MKQLKILCVDDELGRNPKHPLRDSIKKFAIKYNYQASFAEAPESVDGIKAFLSHHKPSFIFLDILHEDRPSSIAHSIRQTAGSMKIPVLIISSNTKEEWEFINKQELKRAEGMDPYLTKFETIAKRYKDNIDQFTKAMPRGALDQKGRFQKIINYYEEQKTIAIRIEEKLNNYKTGTNSKADVETAIKKIIDLKAIEEDAIYKDFCDILKSLSALLKNSNIPNYLKIYPATMKQEILYVKKDTFEDEDVQQMIAQGILSATSQNHNISLEMSGRSIKLEYDQGGSVEYESKLCEYLRLFHKKQDAILFKSSSSKSSDTDMATIAQESRRIASDINKEIKNKSSLRIPGILKTAGKMGKDKIQIGKYCLNIARFVVDGVVRWDSTNEDKSITIIKTANTSSSTAEDMWTVINDLKQQMALLADRISKLESK